MTEAQLTPQQAAAAIHEAGSLDDVLRRRTEGLMWMTWAFIATGTFLSYSLAGATLREYPPWMGLLWVPWAAFGILFTFLLWRSAGIVLTRGAPSMRRIWAHVVLFFLLTIGAVIVGFAFKLPVIPPAVVLFGIGTASALVAVARLRHGGAAAWIVLALGAILMAFAVFESVWLTQSTFMQSVHGMALVNAPIAGLALFLIGLAFYARG